MPETSDPAARLLVYLPAATHEVRARLWQRCGCPAALVPIESGTVALPPRAATLREVTNTRTGRRAPLARRALLACWTDTAALLYAFDGGHFRHWCWGGAPEVTRLLIAAQYRGPVGRAFVRATSGWFPDTRRKDTRQRRMAERVAETLHATAYTDAITAHVRDWARGGPQTFSALFRAANHAELAHVGQLLELGAFDNWLARFPADRVPVWNNPTLDPLPVVPVINGLVFD